MPTPPKHPAMASPSSSSSSSSSSSVSSASSSASSVHPASLVDVSLHSPHTLRLVGLKISKQLIDYVVDHVVETVDYAMGKPSSRGRTTPRTPNQLKFTSFVSTVLSRAEITTPTLLCTLLYITRARPYLHIALEEWALERVFLGALITASKYLNDSTLKNVHWALCTGVFGKRDVGRIEREFLAVLDWELGVSENELLGLWQSLEWAVEMEETEERRVRERELKKRAAAVAEVEKLKLKQQKFFIAPAPAVPQSAPVAPAPAPIVPPKPRTHRRRLNNAAPVHNITLPKLSHSSSSSTDSSSPSSSSSSSSGSVSPRTPSDFDLAYPEPEELARIQKVQEEEQAMDVDVEVHQVPAKRSLKRSFGATTMEILKSFPFPGHHHHHHHPQQQDSQHRKS